MNSITIQQPVKTETVQVTELNLEQILAQVWDQGLPNGIFNTL